MVSVLVSGAIGPGSSPDQGHCVVFLGKTSYSHVPLFIQAPVVQRSENAIQRINHEQADKNKSRYPLDSGFIQWTALSTFRTTGARCIKGYQPI